MAGRRLQDAEVDAAIKAVTCLNCRRNMLLKQLVAHCHKHIFGKHVD